MYEKVNFPGPFGLVLAVMQQPVVVAVEASSSAFLTYVGVNFGEMCFSWGFFHTFEFLCFRGSLITQVATPKVLTTPWSLLDITWIPLHLIGF